MSPSPASTAARELLQPDRSTSSLQLFSFPSEYRMSPSGFRDAGGTELVSFNTPGWAQQHLGMDSPTDQDRLYEQEHLEETLRQQHLQPSHSHFPEPFQLVLSLCCAKRHPGAAGALISIIRPRSVERSEISCYFQLVFQVELIGSWASVPRWRTCGWCRRGEGSSPAHKAAWGTSEGISSGACEMLLGLCRVGPGGWDFKAALKPLCKQNLRGGVACGGRSLI